jgi:thioredoxin reductase (NADPH)
MRSAEIAIIGAGPAGISAAVQCKRLGIVPVLLDRIGEPGGLIRNAYLIENYPGLEKPMSGPEYVELLKRYIERFEIPVEKLEVLSMSREENIYNISCNDENFKAETVIVATGTEPRRLDISFDECVLEGLVFYDVRSLLNRRKNPSNVLIIGGGEAACDYAMTLASAGADVSIYVRGEKLKIRGHLAAYISETPGITISYDVNCLKISATGENGVEIIARTRDGKIIKNNSNAVLIAVGRFSAVQSLFTDSDPISGNSMTSDRPGLFIAGDARFGSLGQLGTAVGDGIRAAIAAVNYLENI